MSTQERYARLGTFDLVGHLINNLTKLLDKEVALAKTEARENLTETIFGSAKLFVGALFGLLAVVSLIVAGILALSLVMPGWLAGIIAFLILGIVAAVTALWGKSEVETVVRHPLERTRDSLQEDLRWARNRLSSSEK